MLVHTRSRSPCGSTNYARKIFSILIGSFMTCLILLAYCSHRIVARQQNMKQLVRAPIHEIERDCPAPTYSVVGDGDGGKICMTTLTDGRKADWLQRLVRWREFDAVLQTTWPNKLNYCMKHGYELFDESNRSLDTSRAPSWSKIKAAKRLLEEEQCDWVFWLDADTVIMNTEKRIEAFLPAPDSGVDFVVTHQKGKSWNAGAWLIRNTEWSHRFLDDWWNMKEFSRVKGIADAGDNEAFKVLLKDMNKIDYDEKVSTPPRCQFNSVAKFLTPAEAARMTPDMLQKDKKLFLNEEAYHKGDFIAHVAGYNNKMSTTQMLLEDAR